MRFLGTSARRHRLRFGSRSATIDRARARMPFTRWREAASAVLPDIITLYRPGFSIANEKDAVATDRSCRQRSRRVHRAKLRGQLNPSDLCARGEQPVLVAEVVIGRARRNLCATTDLTDREVVRMRVAQHLECAGDDAV